MCQAKVVRITHRLYQYLRHPGSPGTRRRCVVSCFFLFGLFLLWLLVVGAMIGWTTFMIKASLSCFGPASSRMLQNLTKICEDEVDDCRDFPGSCYCERIVYCDLDFGDNITTRVEEYKRYDRCYPERCQTGDFCQFVMGHNYTVWERYLDRSNHQTQWTVISPKTHQHGFVLGSSIMMVVLLILSFCLSCLCCLLGRLIILWIPQPRRHFD